MSGKVAVGIDLGTSTSCVAVVQNGRPRVLPNSYGERITASVVSFGADGSILVGNQAKARVILDPRNTVWSSKRLIGRYFFSEEVRKARAISQYQIVEGPNHGVCVKIREDVLSLPEVSALVLREMKRVAEQALGTEVTSAVITVPAYFNDNQRQATKDAGRIAGLEVLRIVNEPTAAALAYGYGQNLSQRVAVYDLGGGTFDVSILEIGKDVFEVLSTCGDTFLGGDDFDDRVLDQLAEEFQRAHGFNPRSDPFAFEKLKAAAEQAKVELAGDDRAHVSIPALITREGQSFGIERELTRAEFEKLVGDLVHRTFKVCDEALQQAGLTVRDLDGVILVGGPTRLPTIREAAAQYFGREPACELSPDEVVAIGAAIHADSIASDRTSTYLLDVTPLSLRIGIAGGLSETILERNTPVPIEATRIFTTARDDQEVVDVRIYQGEERAAEKNELLGQFEFSGFPKMRRGGVAIEVTFAISAEGLVEVSARDPHSGAERSTTVKMCSGLSEEQIRAIIARGRAEKVGGDARTAPPQPPPPPPPPLALPADEEDLLIEAPSELAASLAPPPQAPPDAATPDLFERIEGDLALPLDPGPEDEGQAKP